MAEISGQGRPGCDGCRRGLIINTRAPSGGACAQCVARDLVYTSACPVESLTPVCLRQVMSPALRQLLPATGSPVFLDGSVMDWLPWNEDHPALWSSIVSPGPASSQAVFPGY